MLKNNKQTQMNRTEVLTNCNTNYAQITTV